MKIVLFSINIDDQSSSRFFFTKQVATQYGVLKKLNSEKCKAEAQIDWPVDESITRNFYDSAKTRYNETDSQYFKL